MCRPTVLAFLIPCLVFLGATPATADETTSPVYRTPPQVLTALVDAPDTPSVSAGPRGETLALVERPAHLPIGDLSRPELALAGLRIDPTTNGPSRRRLARDLRLVSVADGSEREIAGLPEPLRVLDVEWSPSGDRIAFTRVTEDGIELWVVEVAAARARRLAGPPEVFLQRAAGWTGAPRFLPDGRSLVVALVPEGKGSRGAAPAGATVPTGPVIQDNAGRVAPARTYQDLLETPHDEALFEHHFAARLARIGLDGSVRLLGRPGIVLAFDPSPDGRFVLAETVHRPFSYQVPVSRFPTRVDVLDAATGETVRTLADLPLREEVPITFGSVPAGPREHAWRDDAEATVVWVEPLDGGDAGREAEHRDRLLALEAPFGGEPVELVRLPYRFGGALWGRDDLALVAEWWWATRTQRLTRIRPGDPATEPELLFEYSWEDRYNAPGNPMTRVDGRGREVVAARGERIWLVGDGASPEGDRPFLDAFDLGSRESRRLFRSEAPRYERPTDLLSLDGGAEAEPTVLVRRETIEEPPDYFVLDLDDLAGGGGAETGDDREAAFRRLTAFPDPTPQLDGVSKELIRYRRADGVELTGTLYLPAGYDARRDGPLPTLLWAYPQEFKSADAASQVTDSPYRYTRVSWGSPLLWLTRGYAVLDDPSMPVVGEGDTEPNDTFVEQLVASAEAAIDALVRRGVTDPARVAIGGHSYGAFMAANLLAHSDLFAAGIARSGAYNRTLTPFGFQAEERSLWEAPEVYVTMSPFLHAHRVDEPILLIHGAADNNSGTFPMQSERFYSALKGHGATVRLVMLPHESHGYRARESILHMLWETDRWLETHVKNRPVAPEGNGESEGGAASTDGAAR